MTVATVALVLFFAALAGWLALVALAYALRALDRLKPDAGMTAEAHRLGVVQKFSGFDPRPEIQHRRARLVREIRHLQAQKAYLDARLRELTPARPVEISSARRVG